MTDLLSVGIAARNASRALAGSSLEDRNKLLELFQEELISHRSEIEDANGLDVSIAQEKASEGSSALIKRLNFTATKFDDCVAGITDVIKLADPLHRVQLSKELTPGQHMYRVSTPIGVLAIIYEARPEAGVQIASLAIKSGNALILKGGSEAIHSNRAVYKALSSALQRARVEEGLTWVCGDEVQLVDTRSEVSGLLKLDKHVDLVIPRGSNALVSSVKSQTSIPVLGHADGICHIYADASLDEEASEGRLSIDAAIKVIVDAKTNYPAACNAVETLLVEEAVAARLLPRLAEAFRAFEGVKFFATTDAAPLLTIEGEGAPAVEEVEYDAERFEQEYLRHHLNVRVVPSVESAVVHVNLHGSGHTDAILTNDDTAAGHFLQTVGSASVYRNCSTRFADGFRYGFGAEVGISTNRIHARGPVGLDGLVTYKYMVLGSGQTVTQVANKEISFTHKDETLHAEGVPENVLQVLQRHAINKDGRKEAKGFLQKFLCL